MRLCFYNPQAVQSVFGELLISKLFRSNKAQTKANSKLGYFLDLLNDKKVKTAIVVDGTVTSIFSATRKSKILNKYWIVKIISFFEIYLWCWFNDINPFKQKIIFKLKDLNPKNDLLFGLAALTNVFFEDDKLDKSFFKLYKGRKIVHLSHYFLDTKKISKNLNIIKPDLYISEADLSKNMYFKHFFKYNKKVYVLPYVLREKYILKTNIKKRKNKCLAVGTLFIVDKSEIFRDVHNFFKVDTLQPMRKSIYKNRTKYKKYIDSYINYSKSTLKMSLVRKIINLLTGKYNKNKYYNFNIVDKYNEYKMFVSPEENTGPPSINFVEGMACGCAYFGIKGDVYSDVGLIDKKNYIAYNGTLSDLKKKIVYYQNHQKELLKIAQNGYSFVRKNFYKEKVVKNFLKDMEMMFY